MRRFARVAVLRRRRLRGYLSRLVNRRSREIAFHVSPYVFLNEIRISNLTHVSHMLTILGHTHYETSLVTCTFQKFSLCFIIRVRFALDKMVTIVELSHNSSETRCIMDGVGRGNYDTAPFPNVI